jgi:hypothetical protein
MITYLAQGLGCPVGAWAHPGPIHMYSLAPNEKIPARRQVSRLTSAHGHFLNKNSSSPFYGLKSFPEPYITKNISLLF